MSTITATAPVTAAKELFAAVGPYAAVADLTAADWAQIAGQCQAGIRVLEATQTLALARVAATDDVVDRDGTVVEAFIGLGHQRLDAPALVSAQLAQSDAGAGRRVAAAVDLVTRLPRLVQAMAAGELDLYRATRVAEELAECPVEVCEEVLDRISPAHLASDPVGPLGRRVRRALAAVNSDLLKKRRIRALSDTGLTRSVDADGVDTWIARMPLEQSAQLWDAIEDRAQTIRAAAASAAAEGATGDGAQKSTTDMPGGAPATPDDHADGTATARPRRMTIHAARLAALTEILMGNITGTFHLHLGVPMSMFGPGDGPEQPTNDDDGPANDPAGDNGSTTDPAADPSNPGSDRADPAADLSNPGSDGANPAADSGAGSTGEGDPANDSSNEPAGDAGTAATPSRDRAVDADPESNSTGDAPAAQETTLPVKDDVPGASDDGGPGASDDDDELGVADDVDPVTAGAAASGRSHVSGPAKTGRVSPRPPEPARSGGASFGLAFPGAAGAAPATAGDPDDLIPVTGFGTAGVVHLRRAFLEHLLRAAMGGPAPEPLPGQTPARFTVTRDVIGCHDETGAYLTGTVDLRHWLDLTDPTLGPPPAAPRTDSYQPTAAIRRLLTARDGRCRFPHCQAAARFADVDHVQAWPAGATALAGLALLCRRHHRIKQRRRWQVRILPDATLEWVTPTGQVRLTTPIDHLEPARTPESTHATDPTDMTGTTGMAGQTDPDGQHGHGEIHSGTGLFGDPTLPPTPPAQLAPELPPRARPSTGDHARGDFGWLHDIYATGPAVVGRQGRVRHPVTITHAELERCSTRGQATRDAAEAERRAAQRTAERAARDAEPPPF